MDDQKTAVLPGQDSKLHAQSLQNQVSNALTDLYGEKVTNGSVTPPDQTDLMNHDPSHLSENSGAELEFNQISETLQGTHKTAPAKNFLHALLNKLKKQKAQEEIV